MARCTWLHLSDWHQRGIDFDRKVVRDKLIEDLRAREQIDPCLGRIDFIVFSGDLAFGGLPEEFEAAREHLLDPVLLATSLRPEQLFIVPGNHDLNRAVIAEMLPSDLQKPFDSDISIKKWLTDEKRQRRAFEPFEAFTSFVLNYTGQSTPEYSNVTTFKVDGVNVALLGINSTWMCGRNKDAKGEVNDYGFLVVGEPQVHDKLATIADAELRIAIMHHSFEWLQIFERRLIRDRLTEACQFIIRGHEHEPDANLTQGLNGECKTLLGGACYDRRKTVDSRYMNSYNLVQLDFSNGTGTVFFRRWSERRTRWIEDSDSCPKGQHSFMLPKSLLKLEETRKAAASRSAVVSTGTSTDKIEAEYLQQTIETYKNLTFRGLTTNVRPILLPLEKVYIPLRAVAEVPETGDEFTPEERRLLRLTEQPNGPQSLNANELHEMEMRRDALRRKCWNLERLERFPIADALKDPSRRGLVILGDPGSGKTTLLHYLALVFARGPQTVSDYLGISGGDADRLPIFVPLAAYDDMLTYTPSLSLREFLAQYYEERRLLPGLAPVFESAIDAGRALLLLDGMDEVLDQDRRKFVAEQVSTFIGAIVRRDNRVLLTSRIYGYRAAPLSVDLPHVTVLDFIPVQTSSCSYVSGAVLWWNGNTRSALLNSVAR